MRTSKLSGHINIKLNCRPYCLYLCFTLLFLCSCKSFGKLNCTNEELYVEFYNIKLFINFDSKFSFVPLKGQVNEEKITKCLNSFDFKNNQVLFEIISSYRDSFQLNDWLFFELIQLVADEVISENNKNSKVLFCFYHLGKSGYQVRLRYTKNEIFLYVKTDSNLFYLQEFKSSDNKFTNVSLKFQKVEQGSGLLTYLYGKNLFKNGKSFSFRLTSLPKIVSKKTIQDSTDTTQINGPKSKITLSCLKELAAFSKNYPQADPISFLEMPLSEILENNIVDLKKYLLNNSDTLTALRSLLTFVRQDINYVKDSTVPGMNDYQSAEETICLGQGDCEDKTVLLYTLIKKMFQIPMLVIKTKTHVTLALSLPLNKTPFLTYKNLNFLICDPTGPDDNLEMGDVPQEIKNKAYQILFEYIP